MAACTRQTSIVKVEAPSVTQAEETECQIGLGYGFLGKKVDVVLNDQRVLSVTGTREIEDHVQLLGTKILTTCMVSRATADVRVVVDNKPSAEQLLDLGKGQYIHIYNEKSGVRIFNTPFLIEE